MTSGIDSAALLEQVERIISGSCRDGAQRQPSVTLAYAQSLDGCIATDAATKTFIGDLKTRIFAHQLRALHDAVLVGVNTVLVDDPQLSVRHVEGPNPRPIVVDSRLRTPLTAQLMQHSLPCIATTLEACERKAAQLEAAGAEIVRLPANDRGQVDLAALLRRLPQRGICSVMVEGGARIITSVLRERLANQIVVTISSELLGGLRAVNELGNSISPRLDNTHCCILKDDLILQGEFAP